MSGNLIFGEWQMNFGDKEVAYYLDWVAKWQRWW